MAVNSKRNRKRKVQPQRPNPLRVCGAAVQSGWERVQWARLITLCTVLAISLSVYVATLWLMNRPIQAVVIDGAFERVSAIQIEDALGRLDDLSASKSTAEQSERGTKRAHVLNRMAKGKQD